MTARGYGLTARARELLVYLSERETCPSFDEMQAALGLKSKSGVHRLIAQLEERGFIRRLANRARAIEVLVSPGEVPHIPVIDRRECQPPPVVVEIPLYGIINLNEQPARRRV